ncbi:hypothetical protein ACFU7Y_27100 [Kitasatospora sp. NPDC057542]|uniref:DUF7144 family membrane protein n=1 Tax=Streptomycetaceae TaxID=2062 RepID=UPI001CC93B97|nr:hypothetical protein [Streptomyces sp. LS1784]
MTSSVSGVGSSSQIPQPQRHPYATGWTIFAGVMLITGGLMAIFEGISAIGKDDLVFVTRNYVYSLNSAGWGWIHLILGVFIVVTGVAVFSGAVWARATGIVVAGLGMIANFLWLPYYPAWAIVLIAIDAFVIWALCVGRIEKGTV